MESAVNSERNWRETILYNTMQVLSTLLGVDMPKKDPVDKVFKLEDDPTIAYVWQVKEEASDGLINYTLNEIQSRFIKENNRAPHSLHIVTKDIEDLKRLGPEEIEDVIHPFIETAKGQHKMRLNE